MPSTHSERLDRWLGSETVEGISRSMLGWHGPPIRLVGVPGNVFACGDGDFTGSIRGGMFAGVLDFARSIGKRLDRAAKRQSHVLNLGFAGLSDLISEATNGKKQTLIFNKAGTAAGAIGQPMSLWNVGPTPVAGGVGGTSGTGRVLTQANTGALVQQDAISGDSLHITAMNAAGSLVGSLLVYDRLWDMTYNHATATSTAVDNNNPPTRYQGTARAPGNFISGEVTTALSATAHNITITYIDDVGNAAEVAAAYAAPVSAAANRTPLLSPNWFLPLNAGDAGARKITNIAQSTTASVTGVSNWFVGHPLVIMPLPIANMQFLYDGVNGAFNLNRVFDGGCIAFMELCKPATGATTYTGMLELCSG